MTTGKRVELYRRLPEIYRIKDEGLPELYLRDGERVPAHQLRSYLEPVEDMFSAIHENIESLYHDFFIETCDDWVIPYIADLLGTSHLSGDTWTLRADVADTIALRRRKGTLGAIELLSFILTKWGVHCVELMENMVWNQHLNHQRPDRGGVPPYGLPRLRSAPVRGGTANLRDPSLLSQLGTPFDPFAHVADVKPHEAGQVRYNLPNLAIYFWRLKACRLNVTRPHALKVSPPSGAPRVVRINVDPVPVNNLSMPYVELDNLPAGRPGTLFNTNRFDLFNRRRSGPEKLNLAAIAPRITSADQVPAPIPVERISDADFAAAYDASLASPVPQPFASFAAASFTAPHEYVSVETYDELRADLSTLDISDQGLQLHLPKSIFPNQGWPHSALPRNWTIRGENLCAWERGLQPPLGNREIAIDPMRGRICIGVLDDELADALVDHLLISFAYGVVGEVGAHPISYPALPAAFDHDRTPGVIYKTVDVRQGPSLQHALCDALLAARQAVAADRNALGKVPIVIEITDSRVHALDIDALPAADVVDEHGIRSIKLHAPLIIRAADEQRPILELARPLAFRPAMVAGTSAPQQLQFDAVMDALFVRLEGLYVARGLDFGATLPLVARAALNKLEILNCTLDPGGFRRFNSTRAPLLPAFKLLEPYGFADADEEREFKQVPEIDIQRSICGALMADEGYRLCIADSIVESIPVAATDSFAITGASDPVNGYAGRTCIKNVTLLGRARVAGIDGSGVIFRGALQAFDQQTGCLKYCWFADDARNRLPQHFACVSGADARLIFTSEYFGDAAYCQLSLECDRRILEQGVGGDQMGAFNFLLEAHKWRNLRIRFREFMPVGIRPLLIPAT
ncbi:hypothetical protein HLB44_32580 [Aquincola sp. S2]|uniref:Phage tail protein (Tail_P2_I) n=1 Tax=Pseudaquabacterium terrae TaxID=2732868 RepID=A0ABX2ESQ0_9BURK|nr:hypothetical protein [Aquabacterium terrae]NRF71735.1 hypothetical protein [Aquabacterium terrae]